MRELRIGDRCVGPNAPCYVVAEVSANHNQSFARAVRILEEARRAGASAVKLQTYTPDTLTIQSGREWFVIPGDTPWAGKTLYELYGAAYTPWEWQPELVRIAHKLDLDIFSTPFDACAVDFLEALGLPAYKIASFELVDLALLRRVAQTGKPVILSTGMASKEEIGEAVQTLREYGAGGIALLKCTSAYPAPAGEMNLRTIPDLAARFDCVAGLSDHTLGGAAAVAAVALGASMVEKHLTLSRSDGGPDSSFSMEPGEFADMVRDIRQAEQALGGVCYERTPAEAANLCFRRSLFVVEDVKAGETFTSRNLRSIRPGYGLPPRNLEAILGCPAARDIPRGTPLSWDLIGRG